ncbi:MAG: hypothetical protein ACI4RQ_06295 [Methanobrevibacter wolinii]
MFGFKVDITSSGMEKLSQKTYTAILSEVLNLITDEAEHEMKKPGFSVAALNKTMNDKGTSGGVTRVAPWGGAPVDTGHLKASIVSDKGSSLVKYIKTPNIEYVNYVIEGTSKMAPNNFPLRAIDALNQNKIADKAVDNVLQERGLK